MRFCRFVCLGFFLAVAVLSFYPKAGADEFPEQAATFLQQYCADCHDGGADEGGLELDRLGFELDDEAVFAAWERIYDRVRLGEMPPEDADVPSEQELQRFSNTLRPILSDAHETNKGTVLRRLNRREYQNTLNDLFGTHLDLEGMLPEDGRSHEFDNVGESLGLSMVHLQKYIDATTQVLDAAIAKTVEAPEPKLIEANYADTREAEQFVGKVWKKLADGAVVRFSGGGYPSGMMRGSGVREPGRYRVRVTGYAHQSESPIVFSVGGTSFARGSEKPIYGYWSFPLGEPGNVSAIEFETWIETNYMIAIEPYGINDPERYQRKTIADYDGPGLAILEVTLEGPLLDQFPSRGHQLIWEGIERREIEPRNPNERSKPWYKPRFEVVSSQEQADAAESIRRVANAAFRRPVEAQELTRYVELFASQREAGSTFEEALRTAVTALFCSPRFLYLDEQNGELDDYALASRLAYFLTRTTPDGELLKLAGEGALTSDSNILRKQTERLLEDERFQRFVVDFCDAWLDLRQMDFTAPDAALFPEYDLYLRHSMPIETQAFWNELIQSNLPVRNIVKSDFAILNHRLADHYNVEGVTGVEMSKVTLPENSLRGGFLTQASVLKVTANGTNTSPVVRGAWVLERFLGETPPPPPPGVPGVEPDIRGASTLRELLDKHRNLTSCSACHQKIDPPGFALEAFNPIGGYRERYRSLGEGERVSLQVHGRNVRYRMGPEVDASGQLPSGESFSNFREFRDLLAEQEDLLARSLASKLLTFASGRELGFSDRAELDRIVAESAQKGHGIRDLFHLVIQSDIFRSK